VNVAGLPLGLPARGRQMIQPTTENKYRFNMQVSARAMGCRDLSLSQPNGSTAQSGFEMFDQWISLASANRRLKQTVAHDSRHFEIASRMRDNPAGRLQPEIGGAASANRSRKHGEPNTRTLRLSLRKMGNNG
jgi:hypothetical protein